MPLPKKPLPFGEWRPDVALLDNQFASIAENVYAGPNSYLPFRGLASRYTDLLPDPACGLTYARLSSGAYVLYAGTATNLYKWTGTVWDEVSLATDGYTVADGDKWTWAQFGPHLVAVQIGDPPQVVNVDSGGNFANLAGSPPTAASVAVIGDFLVLARGVPQSAPLPQRQNMIQWSSVNDIEEWIIGSNLGDAQVFPDGGPVMGVAGGEVGFVLQDKSIRTMQFLPGDVTTIFSFSRIEREKGCIGKSAFCFTRGVLFLLSEDGFYGIGIPNPAIGDHIVNQWFLDHSDPDRRAETQCFSDPRKPHVMWAFYSSGSATFYDRVLIYDWSLNRWTYSTQAAQFWATMASSQIDLDTDIPGDALDIPLDSIRPSLDSAIYQGGRPTVAAIDVNGLLSFLDGNTLAATLETAEAHLSPGMRTFVSGAYPLVDAAPVTVAIGEREQLQIGTTFRNPLPVGSTGTAPVYSSSRLHRFRVFVSANASWTHAQGVVVEAQPDGEGY